MKKWLILLCAIIMAVPAMVYADELELGLAVTPLSLLKGTGATDMESHYGTTSNFLQDNLLGMHAGYSMAWLFYASVDANFMPPWWIKQNTEYTNSQGFQQGVYAPGFITFVDVGIRPTIGPIILMAEMGVNILYVHSHYQEPGETPSGGIGVNLRLGAGYNFGGLSVSLLGTAVFTTFEAMLANVESAVKGDQKAIDSITSALIPSIAVYLHL